MRIVFLIRALEVGGAERQLVTLATGLRRIGHDVAVLVFYSAPGSLEAALTSGGVRLVTLGKSGRWDIVNFVFRLVRALRAERPDVVHGYLDVANVLVTLLGPFLPRVKTVWGVRASAVDFSRYDWTFGAVFQLSRWLSHFPDLIIVNSMAGFTYHASRGYAVGRMIIIKNGVDTEYFVGDAEGAKRVRREFEVSPDGILIGIVGRLDPVKDHVTFLQAAALFRAEVPGARFICIGNGAPEYVAELRRTAESLGLGASVIWAGMRTDLPAIYSALDLLAVTSVSEGFLNVMAEAMSCGVPVVATDVGDAAEIVGFSGTLVPVNDPLQMKAAWKKCLDTAAVRSATARLRIVEQFSIPRLVRETTDALARIVGA